MADLNIAITDTDPAYYTQGVKIVGLSSVITYRQKVLSYSPIAYWMQAEAAGNDAYCEVDSNQDGSYTGVTLGQTGIGDGNTSPLFDGANDFNNVYTTTFRDVFNGAEGTLAIWIKVSGGGVWTDETTRRIVYLGADVQNYITIVKSSTNNRMVFTYEAFNIQKTIDNTSMSETGWMSFAMTWSASEDKFKAYINGSQEGSTQTALGAWVGNLLDTSSCIGSLSTTPTQVWDGYLAHCAVWDSALAPADIADLAVV